MGFGLGVDTARELSAFGEVTDARIRAQMLDEGAAVLDALVAARPVDHLGPHYVAEGVTFQPRPVQRPRPPFWFAARRGHAKPVARAARYDGLFAIELTADQLAHDLDVVAAIRGSLDGFDVAVTAHGNDLATFAAAGVTWVMWDYPPGVALAEVLADARRGPRV
ncbi:MAG: LLM class flavin-dependent oxidoreductase [Acidimicrobiales bacterium]